MDFNDLMNIASSKQQNTEKKVNSKKYQGSGSGQVSSEAVKAFLARKDAEKARQKEQEEAARRARIQARLQQEKKQDKSKNPKKSDESTTAEDLNKQKQKQTSFRKDHHHPSTVVQLPNAQPKRKSGKEPKIAPERKPVYTKGKEIRKIKPGEKSSDKRSDGNEPKKPTSKIKKSAAPVLSFQELMNVAQQQADNPDAVKNLLANRQVKETKPDRKEKTRTRDCQTTDEKLKTKKASGTNKSSLTPAKVPRESSEKRKSEDVSKKKDKATTVLTKPKLLQGREPVVKHGIPEKPRKMTIERETISQKTDRHLPMKRGGIIPIGVARDQRKRRHGYRPDYDDDDYDDEEMDEFIDDSEAGPDISSYIKEIFGYDRKKFRDRDEDVRNMESSFADIQREEAKSARIAKLEDEIERLKESYELQQQNNKKKKLKH